MEEIRPGMLAYSLAGHDKGSLYYIVKADERFVWLSDGKQMCIRDRVRGMDIIFVTTAKTDEEARELLAQFNMPFAK